jgi:hypothetical protein
MNLIEQVGQQLTSVLLGETDANFKTVGAAWTSKPVENFDQETPACWYYLDGLQSEASPYMNEVIQPGDWRVAVLTVCPVGDIEDLMKEVKAALVGFQPEDGAWEAFEHVAGEALDISNSLIWWRDVFAVRNYQQ